MTLSRRLLSLLFCGANKRGAFRQKYSYAEKYKKFVLGERVRENLRRFESESQSQSRQKQVDYVLRRAFGHLPRAFHREAGREKFSRAHRLFLFRSFVRHCEN